MSLVYKSNALVEASYRLSLNEQRIILACIAQVRRDAPLSVAEPFRVRVKDITRATGARSNASYSELKAAAKRLYRREVTILRAPNGEQGPGVSMTRWASDVTYFDDDGVIELSFGRSILPYLSQLTEQFTRYPLADVARMTSTYAIRVYELLCQWRGTGKREIEIDWLRESLQLGGQYARTSELKRCVVNVAVDQINEHSPLWVKYEQRKTGRRVTHLIFTFGEKAVKKEKQLKQDKKLADEAVKPNALYGIPMDTIERLARAGESYEDAALRLLESAKQ